MNLTSHCSRGSRGRPLPSLCGKFFLRSSVPVYASSMCAARCQGGAGFPPRQGAWGRAPSKKAQPKKRHSHPFFVFSSPAPGGGGGAPGSFPFGLPSIPYFDVFFLFCFLPFCSERAARAFFAVPLLFFSALGFFFMSFFLNRGLSSPLPFPRFAQALFLLGVSVFYISGWPPLRQALLRVVSSSVMRSFFPFFFS